MSKFSSVTSRTVAVGVVVCLLIPKAALAHGIGAEDPNRPVPEYLWLGYKHLLEGWDHLLFITAIVLLAGSVWRATKLISLFVAGHSLTLMLATTQEWKVSADLVDVVIALSVLFVAVVGLRGRLKDWTWFGAALFGIGLVHGLGLATRLLDLGVTDDDLVWRVLLFNIGVELGQATAVLALAGFGWVIVRSSWERPAESVRPALIVIALAGAVGAAVLSFPGDSGSSSAVIANSSCTESDTPSSVPTGNASHPGRQFYGPEEPAPLDSFTHVMGDGYVVVTYHPSISAAELAALRREIDGTKTAVVGGADPGQSVPLLAATRETTLTCDEVDLPALLAFRDAWLSRGSGS